MAVLGKLLTFLAISYLLALLIDAAAFVKIGGEGGRFGELPVEYAAPALATLAWGSVRMWSVAAAAALTMIIHGECVATALKRWLRISKRALTYYLSAPLLTYAALGIYASVAAPLGCFDFSAYVELVANLLGAGEQAQASATAIALASILQGYVAAVTLNAFFALGEELGWRGYLFATRAKTHREERPSDRFSLGVVARVRHAAPRL